MVLPLLFVLLENCFLYGLIAFELNTSVSYRKMSHKVKPSIQSLKSMPADYRFLGSPISGPPETNLIIPPNGHLKNGVNGTESSVGGMDSANEDSPYSVRSISNGVRSSISDGDSNLPLPQSNDRSWSDTSAYARKKVSFRFLSRCRFWSGRLLHGQVGLLVRTKSWNKH